MTISTREVVVRTREADGRYFKAEMTDYGDGLPTVKVRFISPGPFPAALVGAPGKVAKMLKELAREALELASWLEKNGGQESKLMCDGGSEGCCGRCKHYDIWRGKCSLNGEKRSPHAPACERFHDITSSTKKHGLTCGDCQYFTIMPDLTTWCKFWEMPVSPDRPACDKFMM